jgi:PHD/YefM family antitoxin component YafN of YafNO toxin-antitoxin module
MGICNLDEWKNFMRTWLRQPTEGQFRKFDEELDEDAIMMRMLAI